MKKETASSQRKLRQELTALALYDKKRESGVNPRQAVIQVALDLGLSRQTIYNYRKQRKTAES